MYYGLLYPRAFLYEGVFSMAEALYEHENLEHVLASEGVEVYRLRDVVVGEMRRSSEFREGVVRIARSVIRYRGDLSDEAYSEFIRNLALYDPETIFDILVLRPIIVVKRGKLGVRAVVVNASPLANLYYTRDQQLVAKNGVVMGRMRMPQRRPEPTITELFFRAIGVPILYRLTKPGFLEGGDFMPMGDSAVLGYGFRSSLVGVNKVLGILDFDELALAKIPSHPWGDDMLVMHIDTYFNIIGDGLALGNEDLMANTQVTIVARAGDRLEKVGETNLLDYVRQKGFNIIPLTLSEQAAFAANILTIKDRRIVVPNVEMNLKKMIRRLQAYGSDDSVLGYIKSGYEKLHREGRIFPYRPDVLGEGIDFITVDVSELVGGYGGVHCAVAAVQRI